MAASAWSRALDLGLGEVWIPARAPAGRAPGHPAHDSFWARLAERAVPFVLHVGSGALPIGEAWFAVRNFEDHTNLMVTFPEVSAMFEIG